MMNFGLTFTDQVKHLQEKLGSAIHYRQFMVDVCNEMIKSSKLDENEIKIAKENFNIVCNYQKRKNENILSENLYTEPLVKYLV